MLSNQRLTNFLNAGSITFDKIFMTFDHIFERNVRKSYPDTEENNGEDSDASGENMKALRDDLDRRNQQAKSGSSVENMAMMLQNMAAACLCNMDPLPLIR